MSDAISVPLVVLPLNSLPSTLPGYKANAAQVQWARAQGQCCPGAVGLGTRPMLPRCSGPGHKAGHKANAAQVQWAWVQG